MEINQSRYSAEDSMSPITKSAATKPFVVRDIRSGSAPLPQIVAVDVVNPTQVHDVRSGPALSPQKISDNDAEKKDRTKLIWAIIFVVLFLSPLDVAPDVIPVLGWIDDIFYLAIAVSLFGAIKD